MKHTPEPWLTDSTAKFETQEQIDYHRACICVNACAGSSTEWLRGYGDMLNSADCAKPLQQNIRDLSSQRDELLAALKLAEQWLEGWASAESELKTIRAVIAKYEAKS